MAFGFGRGGHIGAFGGMLGQNSNHIYFVEGKNNKWNSSSRKTSNTISLPYENLEYIPQLFTISNNNASYKFNTYFLKDTSPVIKKALDDNENLTEYHLDIKDDDNVMQKFEDMYQGKNVILDISDLAIFRKIAVQLEITNCPRFMKPESDSNEFYTIPAKPTVTIDFNSVLRFIQNEIPKTFTIIKNDKEYKCNIYGIHSSNVIHKLFEKDPNLNTYVYNCDYEDENDDFKLICRFFNYEVIKLTSNNMDSLKKFAEDLQINMILDNINNFIDSYENMVQMIDDKKVIIDTVDEIFNWLYKIKDLTVEKVTLSILQSIWVRSIENVQELAACILQVSRTRILLQPFLIDLLISLDKAAGSNEHLKFLLPFTTQQLKYIFYKNKLHCAFIFKFYQRGLVTMEEIIKIIKKDDSRLFSDREIFSGYEIFENCYHANIVCWFYPELIEMLNVNKDTLFSFLEDNKNLTFYRQMNIDSFKKTRETGEPSDKLSRAIIHDDVDTLQSIISTSTIDVNKEIVPFSIFEIFDNMNKKYIDYAAEYGSIKCFKYLLLNHSELNSSSLSYAIYGGNTEIIRIIDQQYDSKPQVVNKKFKGGTFRSSFDDNLSHPIVQAITTHQNDLLDWLLEQKFVQNGKDGISFPGCAQISAENGNAHSFIEFVDKDPNLYSCTESLFKEFVRESSQNGFYRLLQLIFSLDKKSEDGSIHYGNYNSKFCLSYVSFGNLSIYKLASSIEKNLENNMTPMNFAIERDYINIIHYMMDNVYHSTRACFLSKAIGKKSPEIFNYLMSKFNFNEQKGEIIGIINAINCGCLNGDFESVKTLSELIFNNCKDIYFTQPFISCCESKNIDICNYFIEKKILLNYYQIAQKADSLSHLDEKIIIHLLNQIDLELKDTFIIYLLEASIRSGNIKLVEFLLSTYQLTDKTLVYAVLSGNIDIVNIVLKHNSKPEFINQIWKKGTALTIAVKKNFIQIVKRLLSLPGIDVNLYQNDGNTPLMTAVLNLNVEMIKVFLDFFGDEIEKQAWQLNDALKEILRQLSGSKEKEWKERHGFMNPEEAVHKKPNFIVMNKSKISDVISLLVDVKGIELNCHVSEYTLLTLACETNEIELVKILLKSSKVNVNEYSPLNSKTPLMIAIEKGNIEIIDLLINHPQIDINFRNYNQQTALTIASYHHLETVINLLVSHPKFDPKQSCLNYAFFFSEGETTKQLYNIQGLDVNFKIESNSSYATRLNDIEMNRNMKAGYKKSPIPGFNQLNYEEEKKRDQSNLYIFETTLIHAINMNQVEMVDMIIKHPTFDPVLSQIKAAIFVAVNKGQIDIFKTLLKLVDDDVNIFSMNGQSLLQYSVQIEDIDMLRLILSNEKFDSERSGIINALQDAMLLNKTFSTFNQMNQELPSAFIAGMEEIYDFEESKGRTIDFNAFLKDGKTFLTSMSNIRNAGEVVRFILDHGGDPNLPNAFNIFPLQYAIKKNLLEMINELLGSPQIDVNVKLMESKMSILHFAASFGNEMTLRAILDSNVIDINSRDDMNETPLMKACSMQKQVNIIILFLSNDLDYLAVNDKGEDAIMIAKNAKKKSGKMFGMSIQQQHRMLMRDIQPPEKLEYLNKILDALKPDSWGGPSSFE